MIWIAITALIVGLLLILAGKSTRQKRGLTDATTLDLDTRVLYSARYDLAGRPDRLFRDCGFVIPEEWKSSLQVYDSHRAQLGCYFILVEEEFGVRLPYGVIVTGDHQRHEVENTDQLRAWVLELAERIRTARRELNREIPVRQPTTKCRACGMREGCGQWAGVMTPKNGL
jgi:CRISPR-associated exonuclease Cas4